MSHTRITRARYTGMNLMNRDKNDDKIPKDRSKIIFLCKKKKDNGKSRRYARISDIFSKIRP